jgi:hypothetical protein
MGRDGALRRHRAVQERNTFGEFEHRGSIRSARCMRAGTAQRAFPTTKLWKRLSFSGSNASDLADTRQDGILRHGRVQLCAAPNTSALHSDRAPRFFQIDGKTQSGMQILD